MNTIDNVTVIEMNGDLDSNSAQQIQGQILTLAANRSRVLLDMSNVRYMSSAGLRLLLLVYRQVSEHVGHVAIAGLNDEVKDVMMITGFLDFFSTFDTPNDGVRALSA